MNCNMESLKHLKKISSSFSYILVKIAITLIKCYKLLLSPWLGNSCIFEPTCSSYALESFKRFGFFHGFYLTAKRILRCNPWGKMGYDPVPNKKINRR